MNSANLLVSFKIIVVYFYPIITIIGIFANLISFIIFSQRKFHSTVFALYYRYLLIMETISLILPINKFMEANMNMYVERVSDVLCKFRIYLSKILPSMSSWILVVISVDRFLSITYPNKFNCRKKKYFIHLVCLVLFLIDTVYYIPYLFYYLKEFKTYQYQNQTNMTILYYRCTNPTPILWILDYVQSTLIPFILMIFFTSFTLKSLFKSRQLNGNTSNMTRQKDMRFAFTSIALNIIFILLNGPFYMINLLYATTSIFKSNTDDLFVFVSSFFLLFFYINRASSFFINITFNKIFRNEFYKLFFIKNRNRNSHSIVSITVN